MVDQPVWLWLKKSCPVISLPCVMSNHVEIFRLAIKIEIDGIY